jgi:hypothetical protein
LFWLVLVVDLLAGEGLSVPLVAGVRVGVGVEESIGEAEAGGVGNEHAALVLLIPICNHALGLDEAEVLGLGVGVAIGFDEGVGVILLVGCGVGVTVEEVGLVVGVAD